MFLRWKKKLVSRVAEAGEYKHACQHSVPTERVTPQILESYRDKDGKPKHRVIWTGPSFRLCCIELHIQRARWWTKVQRSIGAVNVLELSGANKKAFLSQIASIIPCLSSEEWMYYESYVSCYITQHVPGETWDQRSRRLWVESMVRHGSSGSNPGTSEVT